MKFVVFTLVSGGSLYDIFANEAAMLHAIPVKLAAFGAMMGQWAGSVMTVG